MKIQGLEKLSLVDYDGYAAATVFLAGCNLRCPFCQNAALLSGSLPALLTEDEFFAFLSTRKGLLDAVCITGGEPTLRPDLPDFCRRIKAAGFRVKLDTNGTAPALLHALVADSLLDYVAMDIKAPLSDYPLFLLAGERETAAVSESIAYLLTNPVPYEFRTTLVNEMIDEGGIREIGGMLTGAPRLFLQKFSDRGGNLTDGLSAVPRETAERYAAILRVTVGAVTLRGYD